MEAPLDTAGGSVVGGTVDLVDIRRNAESVALSFPILVLCVMNI
jgi:hypothetical protein